MSLPLIYVKRGFCIQLEAMQNIAKACQSKLISELEQVVEEHSQHVSSDPIIKVGSNWKHTTAVGEYL